MDACHAPAVVTVHSATVIRATVDGNLLVERGFDEEYRPTPEGQLLEDLVDRLFLG